MKTFQAAFRSIYEPELAKYGFKKLKTKYPYYGKMVGDEIVHLISYTSKMGTIPGWKAFEIVSGVATVYRGEINLNINAKDNTWLIRNSRIFGKNHMFDEEMYDSGFEYRKDDEDGIIKAISDSIEPAKRMALPALNEATGLKESLDYFEKYGCSTRIYNNRDFGAEINDESEGLLYFICYDYEGYMNQRRQLSEKDLKSLRYSYEHHRTGFTEETFQEFIEFEREGRNKNDKEVFNMYNDKECMKRMAEELERRKQANIQALKGYNFF